MKSAEWKYVKVGNYVIYADEDDGVHKAQVIETDIKETVEKPYLHFDYPYGKTAETGVVKIKYNENELVANLADLVKFNPTYFRQLEKAWREWQNQKVTAEMLKDEFTALRSELREA
jgi:hypothetical protein